MQIPKIGMLISSNCLITGMAYLATAKGSAGPLDKKMPSGECAIISSKLDFACVVTTSKFTFVDLAGSERGDRTGAAVGGARQKEANHINQSISRLMNCLRVVREKQHHPSSSLCVPWRESKLTHLFQYLLQPPNDGQIARVSMVVCASPAAADHSETTYVVGNAAQAKAVAALLQSHQQSIQQSKLPRGVDQRLRVRLAHEFSGRCGRLAEEERVVRIFSLIHQHVVLRDLLARAGDS